MWNICRQCPLSILNNSSIFGVNKFNVDEKSSGWSLNKDPLNPTKTITTNIDSKTTSTVIDTFIFHKDLNISNGKSPSQSNDKVIEKSHITDSNNSYREKLESISNNPQSSSKATTTITTTAIINEQPNTKKLTKDTKSKDLDIKHKKFETEEHQPIMNYVNNQDHLTEYKRQFQWSLPMVEPKVSKPEPMMSQYQISFGHSQSQPNSLVNSYSCNDVADSMTLTSSSMLTNNYRSKFPIAPGGAVRNFATPHESAEESKKTEVSDPSQITINNNNNNDRSLQTDFVQEQIKTSSSLFNYEPPERSPSPYDPTKSEYNAKFKDFNEYVYVEGDGFKKGDRLSMKAKMMAQSWFSEVKERSKQACKYRARSRNGSTPVNPEYSWNGVSIKDRDLQALALATRLMIEEKKSERSGLNNKTRSVSAKPHSRISGLMENNSAPPSLQDDRSRSVPKTVPRPVPIRKRIVKSNELTATNVTISNPSTKTIVDKNNNTKSTTNPLNKASVQSTITEGSKKIWIKPTKKIPNNKEDNEKKVGVELDTKTKIKNEKNDILTPVVQPEPRQFEAEPKQVPLRTTQIKSPEEIAGIKSPSPESWKVTIEKGGLNWVNGNTPVNFGDGKSLLQQNNDMVRPVPINASINDDLYGPLSV